MAQNPLTPFRGGSLSGGGGSDPFLTLHREMNRLFDDVFRGGSLATNGGQSAGVLGNFVNARMDVSETEKEIRVMVELPGVSEEDINVSLDDDVLTIQGEKKLEEAKGDEKENFHFLERSYGAFQRALRLPVSVDPERVKAHFKNGVLTVTLPKTGQQERSRKIRIEGAGADGGQDGSGEARTSAASDPNETPGVASS